MVDQMALFEDDSVYDFKTPRLSYEQLRTMTINMMAEEIMKILNNPDTSNNDKIGMVMASMSYLSMQNFVLWYDVCTKKQEAARQAAKKENK